MIDTWAAITSRRNVREFSDREIPAAGLERILDAGRLTPSARNWQPWDFVVVSGAKELERLSKVWQGGAHIAGAQVAIVIVLPVVEEERKRLTAHVDLGQGAAFIQIAAADLGIGCGHSIVEDQDLARELLGIPADREAALILDLGYPAGRPLTPGTKLSRRSREDVIHDGSW